MLSIAMVRARAGDQYGLSVCPIDELALADTGRSDRHLIAHSLYHLSE